MASLSGTPTPYCLRAIAAAPIARSVDNNNNDNNSDNDNPNSIDDGDDTNNAAFCHHPPSLRPRIRGAPALLPCKD